MRAAPSVFLIAGEPSGDALGAKLMAALRELTGGSVVFSGVGGERMIDEGLRSLFPMEELAVMGLAEVLPRVPRLLRRVRETAAAVAAARPSVLVTIDAPSFCFRVTRRVRPLGVPRVHYVAPQLWAWRPERARTLHEALDRLLVILPFEPAFFARFGIATTYVGHPVIEEGAGAGDGARFRSRHGLPAEAPLLAVLPGSRVGEVERLLPIFAAAVRHLAAARPGLRVAMPMVQGTEAILRARTADWATPPILIRDRAEKFDAFAAATAALTSSGTVTLELALSGLPMIVAHRVNALTGMMARRLLTVPHVSLPNLVAGRGVVPELLQQDCRPAGIAAAVAGLLDDAGLRSAQRADLAEVAARLDGTGDRPSLRAARAVMGRAAPQSRPAT